MFMFMKSRAGCSQAPAPSLTASRALRILFFLPLPSSRIFDPPVAPLQLSTFTLSFKLILPPYLQTQITLHHVKAVFLGDSTHQETGPPSLFPSLVLSVLGFRSALASITPRTNSACGITLPWGS